MRETDRMLAHARATLAREAARLRREEAQLAAALRPRRRWPALLGLALALAALAWLLAGCSSNAATLPPTVRTAAAANQCIAAVAVVDTARAEASITVRVTNLGHEGREVATDQVRLFVADGREWEAAEREARATPPGEATTLQLYAEAEPRVLVVDAAPCPALALVIEED